MSEMYEHDGMLQDGGSVRRKKFRIAAVVFILAALLFIAGCWFLLLRDDPEEKEIVTGGVLVMEDGKTPAGTSEDTSVRFIEIPVYSDIYVDAQSPEEYLENPMANDGICYMQYHVQYGHQELLADEIWIEPGRALPINFYELFEESGTYVLDMQISTIDIATGVALNGAEQTVCLTVGN